jgi:2,5-diketo-D-gluconate reductase A
MIDQIVAATGVSPAVNQIEWSPLLFDRAVLEGHRERGVVVEGYSALRGGTLDHPTIERVAQAHGRSTAQVIVRWHLQHGIVVIPKSVRQERIVANAQVGDFELTDDEMRELDALGPAS